MYINGIPFFMTIPRKIHFGTAELMKNEKIATIMKALRQVANTYHARGFKIWHIIGEQQFKHA
jgi:hypothetical protein